MSRLDRLPGGLGRLVATILLGFLLAEALVSWLAPQALLVIEPGLYEADPPGRYRLSPGYRGTMTNRVEFEHQVAVDERGLRSSGTGDRTGGAKIMAIGDSFAFGMGVADEATFVAALAERRAAIALNGGLPGTGVPDVVEWYERRGRALDPDTLILAIFVGNDLADARPDREAIKIVDGLVAPADTPAGVRSWLYRRSDLVRLLKSAAGSPALVGVRQRLGLSEPWIVRNLRHEFSIYAVEPSDELLEAERTTDRALARLAGICARDGTRLVAALLPARVQLDPTAWEASLAMLELDPTRHDANQPNRVFASLLERHAIPWLDLAPVFAASIACGEELYYRKDRHWNQAGHALAASELARFLD